MRQTSVFEKLLDCCIVSTLLKQDIKFGAGPIEGRQSKYDSLQSVTNISSKYDIAGPATRSFDAMREARAKFIPPVSDRFISDDHPRTRTTLRYHEG
jgi:hypothetical protein